MEYNSEILSFEDIMDLFFKSHTPENKSGCNQYRSIIFYHNEEQKIIAERKKVEYEVKGFLFNTDIVPFDQFHLAEFYHQKYYLQKYPLLVSEVEENNEYDFINNVKSTKLNGYCGGYGTIDYLDRDMKKWHFSKNSLNTIKEILKTK